MWRELQNELASARRERDRALARIAELETDNKVLRDHLRVRALRTEKEA